MIHPRLFHTFSFFCHPTLEKERFFLANGLPREYHDQCYVAEVQTLVELNPNMGSSDGNTEKLQAVSLKFARFQEQIYAHFFILGMENIC